MPRNPLLKGLAPIHPGQHLREDIVPALGKPKSELARLLGISRQTFYDVLNEQAPITPNLALRIGKLVGGGAEVWLKMQQAFDLDAAERKIRTELKAIPTLRAA